MVVKTFVPKRMTITSEIWGIYDNLIDNAIEACMKIKNIIRLIKNIKKWNCEAVVYRGVQCTLLSLMKLQNGRGYILPLC